MCIGNKPALRISLPWPTWLASSRKQTNTRSMTNADFRMIHVWMSCAETERRKQLSHHATPKHISKLVKEASINFWHHKNFRCTNTLQKQGSPIFHSPSNLGLKLLALLRPSLSLTTEAINEGCGCLHLATTWFSIINKFLQKGCRQQETLMEYVAYE